MDLSKLHVSRVLDLKCSLNIKSFISNYMLYEYIYIE